MLSYKMKCLSVCLVVAECICADRTWLPHHTSLTVNTTSLWKWKTSSHLNDSSFCHSIKWNSWNNLLSTLACNATMNQFFNNQIWNLHFLLNKRILKILFKILKLWLKLSIALSTRDQFWFYSRLFENWYKMWHFM